MPAVQIACPHCSQSLQSRSGFSVGARVQCPRCKAAFTLKAADLRVAAVASADPAPRPAWVLPAVGAAVGLLLLLVAGGVVLALVLTHKPTPQHAAAPPPPVVPTPSPVGDPPSDPSGPPPLVLPAPPDVKPEPELEEPTGLTLEQEADVKKAIDRGVAYLENAQGADGSWAGAYPVGDTALPGLTLLETGVAADDPHVAKAAAFMRKAAPALNRRGETYELALAVLFLDKLGDPGDDRLIQTLALRIIAAQTPSGGWGYKCPALDAKDEQNLLTVLRKTRPTSAGNLVAPPSGDGPAGQPGVMDAPDARKALAALPAALQQLPALQPPKRDGDFPQAEAFTVSDNSNTQFAILALWTARRHDVPAERTLALVNQRFRLSQNDEGGWAYLFSVGGTKQAGQPAFDGRPAMNAAGLLGLAVGHGVTADLKAADATPAAGADAAVEKGMRVLAAVAAVGATPDDGKTGRVVLPQYLYFLWSVERVGVLFNRRTIGDLEWYPWGAKIILEKQAADGSWDYMRGMPAIGSSFALLFLKRANLAKDLSAKIQFLSQMKK